MSSIKFKKIIYFLSAFLLLNVRLLAQGSEGTMEDSSDLWLFIGRFHPLIVHLPIGFILLAFLMELMAKIPRFKHLEQSVSFVLSLGILTSVGAALFGYLLSLSGEYQGSTLKWHLYLGLATLGLAIVALVLKSRASGTAYFTALSASVICLTFTGHLGGNLTHGSDYLVRYMPNKLRLMAGLPPKQTSTAPKITNLEEAIIFDDFIKPITDSKCESCHNAEKTKGDLRLDIKEGFLKGGENGPSLAPGQPAQSELFKRVKLPKDHEDVMPPDGKKPLNGDEIALLEWWITHEASFDKKVGEVEITEEIKEILDEIVHPKESQLNPVYTMEIEPLKEGLFKKLKELGFSASPLSYQSPFIQISYLNSGIPLGKDHLNSLKNIAEHIAWLDLSHAKLEDGLSFDFLKDFKHLTKLHLDNTAISDQEMQYLSSNKFLEYLNLYGAAGISDQSVNILNQMKLLKHLYLWQTSISESGKSELQQANPKLEIIADKFLLTLEEHDDQTDSIANN